MPAWQSNQAKSNSFTSHVLKNSSVSVPICMTCTKLWTGKKCYTVHVMTKENMDYHDNLDTIQIKLYRQITNAQGMHYAVKVWKRYILYKNKENSTDTVLSWKLEQHAKSIPFWTFSRQKFDKHIWACSDLFHPDFMSLIMFWHKNCLHHIMWKHLLMNFPNEKQQHWWSGDPCSSEKSPQSVNYFP